MTIETLPQAFSVCKVDAFTAAQVNAPFHFTAVTDGERSLVCPTAAVPANATVREDGWRALRVAGTMEFALVGILYRLTGALASEGIPVFAVSTFDTDYLFIKEEHWTKALAALETDGCTLRNLPETGA